MWIAVAFQPYPRVLSTVCSVHMDECEESSFVYSSKHSPDSSLAGFQVDGSTLSELGDKATALKYWPCFCRPILLPLGNVLGNSAHVAISRLLSSIHARDAYGGALPVDFITAAVLGEGRYSEGPGEKLDGNRNLTTVLMIPGEQLDGNRNWTTVLILLHHSYSSRYGWASMELIAQADIVIMDKASSRVGKFISLMSKHYRYCHYGRSLFILE